MMKSPLLPAFFAALLLLALIPASAPGQAEADLRKFLHSTPGTYGWSPVKGDISYDFFVDGRLHVQGPDGEATMWTGTWKLKGDRLTLVVPELKKNSTVTVAIEGDELLLDGERYRRYTP